PSLVLEERSRMKQISTVPVFGRAVSLAVLCLFMTNAFCAAQNNAPPPATSGSKVLGEVKLEGASKVEKEAGVWVDGNYVGYLKELKGDKKLLLLPGEHEVAVRRSGYDAFVRKGVGGP